MRLLAKANKLPSMFLRIDRRGTRRFTICVGPWAVKFARNAKGRACNQFEANVWETEIARRDILCPVLACLPFGVALIMQRAETISEQECEALKRTPGFPDWDYIPGGRECPFEPKASDWGRLSDGRLVALDYSAGAES
jgi:hypothetical protein